MIWLGIEVCLDASRWNIDDCGVVEQFPAENGHFIPTNLKIEAKNKLDELSLEACVYKGMCVLGACPVNHGREI